MSLLFPSHLCLSLQEGVCRCVRLRTLYAYDNVISEAPGDFEDMGMVTHLYMGGNLLSRLGSIGSLRSLQKL